MHIRYVRNDTCDLTITNVWLDPVTNVARYASVNQNWFDPGTYERNEYFTVPDDLPDADWHLIKKTVNHCGNSFYYTTNFDLTLHVTGVVSPLSPTAAPAAPQVHAASGSSIAPPVRH